MLSRSLVGGGCFLLLGFVQTSFAADPPWEAEAFTADAAEVLKALSAAPAPEGADSEILFFDATYVFDDQGRRTVKTREVIHCLTPLGVQDRSVAEATWSPWHEERPTIRARVVILAGRSAMWTDGEGRDEEDVRRHRALRGRTG